ncbi:hypothetical protein [Novosphingobium sp.]|uniref:head-tail connector protein n=1 Tax=Novosphingobium sp. TaxID=1874826 RepID=UPI0026126F85|nr:hypothetical protein [Novosphingobium sp.]
MKRTIITPAALVPTALAELKNWLGIAATTTGDDAGLTALLRAALDGCEAFTGALPLLCTCEEVIGPGPDWQGLVAGPVQVVSGVQGFGPGLPRADLPAAAYAIDLSAEGGGRVRILAPGPATRFAVRFQAGLAADWAGLPDGLRHGIVRLAAHGYRQRDVQGEGIGPAVVPPPAVAALWRPWRGVRLL